MKMVNAVWGKRILITYIIIDYALFLVFMKNDQPINIIVMFQKIQSKSQLF